MLHVASIVIKFVNFVDDTEQKTDKFSDLLLSIIKNHWIIGNIIEEIFDAMQTDLKTDLNKR